MRRQCAASLAATRSAATARRNEYERILAILATTPVGRCTVGGARHHRGTGAVRSRNAADHAIIFGGRPGGLRFGTCLRRYRSAGGGTAPGARGHVGA